jgi:hypothetical protein
MPIGSSHGLNFSIERMPDALGSMLTATLNSYSRSAPNTPIFMLKSLICEHAAATFLACVMFLHIRVQPTPPEP